MEQMEKLKKLKLLSFPHSDNQKPLKIFITDRIIGRGNQGEVRVGYNKEEKTQAFAVKIIDNSRLKTRVAQQDLKNEIELLTMLKSQNLVTMKAVVEENEDYYIAMELCNGGSLQKLLNAKGGFLSESEAR